jgi:hypothetical protein
MSQYDRSRLPTEQGRRHNRNGWSKFRIAVGVIAAVLLVMNAGDLGRYLKISNM